jgi:DNA-directed RNA polymerase I and III subunit RPAC1
MSEIFTHYRVHSDHQVPEVSKTPLPKAESYLDELMSKLKIQVTNLTEEVIEFDLVGVDAAIANALRRILLAEVPTVAIEHVWIAINSSIIQDEVLAHRVGLIPIKVDPSKLDYVVNEEETDRDTIVFHFDVECTNEIVTDRHGKQCYKNENALSGALSWLPQGNQEEAFPGKTAIAILVNSLFLTCFLI